MKFRKTLFLFSFLLLSILNTNNTFAEELGDFITSDDDTFTLTKPLDIKWYPLKITENQYQIKLNNHPTENIDYGYFHISTLPISKTGLDISVINNSLIGNSNCNTHIKTTISGFIADEYICFSIESDTKALREFREIYLQTNDNLYNIKLDYGRNNKSKKEIDELRSIIKIKPFGNRNTNNLVSITQSPMADIHINNSWAVYTPSIDIKNNDIFIPLIGFNKENSLDSFYFSYFKPENKSLSNTDYLNALGTILNGGYFKNKFITELNRNDSFLLNNRIGNGIKIIRQNKATTSYKNSSEELYVYDVMYFIRNQGDFDIMITYTFITTNPNDSSNKITIFENNVIEQISFPKRALLIDKYASLNGTLKRSISNSAVYLVKDNKRYVFPNFSIYSSWFTDFSSVQTISDSEMASYKLTSNITYKPGTLIKIPTNPKVYVVEKDNLIRWIKSEQLAIQHFGTTWAKKVKDVGVSEFMNYIEGEDVK